MAMKKGKVLIESFLILGFFLIIAFWRWWVTGNFFYIINFGYIGVALCTGNLLWNLLPKDKKTWGRRISQLLVGFYMLGFLGFVGNENMQIEGFFFYLLGGFFFGASLHYLIAKLAGPFLFGRAWCGWACWTAMILDLLPWKRNDSGRIRHLGFLRYFHFFISLSLVYFLWKVVGVALRGENAISELYWLIAGNSLYYVSGIILAAVLKDNRAFCKYLCPITVFLKIGSRFALVKIRIDADLCTECGLCEKNCPMDIALLEYKRKGKRITSTECVFCQNCLNICPVNAIRTTASLDAGFREMLRFRSVK